MNHAQMIDTYSNRAMHFATRARIHHTGAVVCRAAGLKTSAHRHATSARAARAYVLDAAEVVVAELTLKAAMDRLANSNAAGVMMPDPFNPSRGVKAYWHNGQPAAYFIPLA